MDASHLRPDRRGRDHDPDRLLLEVLSHINPWNKQDKLLFDFYHSQISEGHMIYNFDKCFDEIGYVQTGDVKWLRHDSRVISSSITGCTDFDMITTWSGAEISPCIL